jgi:hypothetical protein
MGKKDRVRVSGKKRPEDITIQAATERRSPATWEAKDQMGRVH